MPKSVYAEGVNDVTKAELVELIKLQKEQIGDYKNLALTQEDQITQLNQYLADCRSGRKKDVTDCADKLVKCENRSRTAYIIGTIIAVVGAGFGTGMYVGR